MELLIPRKSLNLSSLPRIRFHGSVKSAKKNRGSSFVSRFDHSLGRNRWKLRSMGGSQRIEFSRPSTSSGLISVVVDLEEPSGEMGFGREDLLNYYVGVLARIVGDEKVAQSCIYDAVLEKFYRFHCEIDKGSYKKLSGLGSVLGIRPDEGTKSDPIIDSSNLIVKMRKPSVEIVTRAQMADYYADTVAKILGNRREAQASIYHLSWERNLGFCCQVDGESARRLADLPEVLNVLPDQNIESIYKDYGGNDTAQGLKSSKAPVNEPNSAIKTKRLFVAGLSFYTSEKTLREAFEGFGDLVEVKIIIDTISKRSKGYAFIEYTTEEAAAIAMKEMNGKIINGWMIVVDVAKISPSKRSGGTHRGYTSS